MQLLNDLRKTQLQLNANHLDLTATRIKQNSFQMCCHRPKKELDCTVIISTNFPLVRDYHGNDKDSQGHRPMA